MSQLKIRVVVVDDSALVRKLLAEIINRQTAMQRVVVAADPLVAREMIHAVNPDVITLDVEMPRMDGIDFLSRLMRLRSTPVVMVSTLTERGTEATRTVLTEFRADMPAVLITQHMPPGFTTSYAKRLDSLCQIRVEEAVDGERILPGHGYLAPVGMHLSVERSGANYVARVCDGDPVNRHKPSVEVLFESAARIVGPNAVGITLTGMGGDGAQAMRAMRDAGSWNICQDEASCIVFGMPREAIARGGAHEVLPLDRIAGAVIAHLRHAVGGAMHRIQAPPRLGERRAQALALQRRNQQILVCADVAQHARTQLAQRSAFAGTPHARPLLAGGLSKSSHERRGDIGRGLAKPQPDGARYKQRVRMRQHGGLLRNALLCNLTAQISLEKRYILQILVS